MNTDGRKITALMDRLERIKLNRENEPEPDALTLSLLELGAELAALDEEGIAAKAAEWGISPDDVRDMTRTYSR